MNLLAQKLLGRDLRLPEWGGLIALFVFISDRITKWWVLEVVDLDVRRSVEVLPFFDLSMVWNKGVSFGLFQAGSIMGRTVLFLFAVAVSAVLIRWLLEAERRLQAIFLGMIIGGALGNALDRVFYGAVVDFLDFSKIAFPFGFSFKWVFNIADTGISVGVGLLVLDALFAKDETPESPKS